MFVGWSYICVLVLKRWSLCCLEVRGTGAVFHVGGQHCTTFGCSPWFVKCARIDGTHLAASHQLYWKVHQKALTTVLLQVFQRY